MGKTFTIISTIILSSIALTGCSSPTPTPTSTPTKTAEPTPTFSATPNPTSTNDITPEEKQDQKVNKIEFAKIVDKSYQKALNDGLTEFRSDHTFIGAYNYKLEERFRAGMLDDTTGKYKLLAKPDGNFIILSTQMNLMGINKGYVLPPEAKYIKQTENTWIVTTPAYTADGWDVPESQKTYLLDKDGYISKVFVKATTNMPAYYIDVAYKLDGLALNILDRSKATVQA